MSLHQGILLRWTEKGEEHIRVFVAARGNTALKEAQLWASTWIETVAYRTKVFVPIEIREVDE